MIDLSDNSATFMTELSSALVKANVAPDLARKVAVTATWVTPANAKADIQTSTGMIFPADSVGNEIFVTLWEGPDDSDDFAVLFCGDVPVYVAPNGEVAPFVSAPTTGYAYIVAQTINRRIA